MLGRTRIFVVALALLAVVVVAGPAGSADRDRREERAQGKRHSHPAGDMPARFVAEAGGRVVVVSVKTGRVEKYLTGTPKPGGGAVDPVVSPDGRSVWFSRGDGDCAAHLASVPAGGGKERAVPGSGEAGPEERPLPRPGHAQLAFARTDCDEPAESAESLFVADVRGLEGYGQTGLLPMGWSTDGKYLLAQTSDGTQVRRLTVNNGGAIVTDTVVDPPDRSKECRLEVIGFSPDDNHGYVAVRRCGNPGQNAWRSLVLLDKTGAHRKTVLRLPRGRDFVDRVVFDAVGQSLLFSTARSVSEDDAGAVEPEATLWLWRDGKVQQVIRDSPYRHPSWLP